jgi:hypothetical protein
VGERSVLLTTLQITKNIASVIEELNVRMEYWWNDSGRVKLKYGDKHQFQLYFVHRDKFLSKYFGFPLPVTYNLVQPSGNRYLAHK